MMFASGGALVAAAYPPRRLGAAMGVFYAVNAVAHIAGPVLGGVTAGLGWQWLFWMKRPRRRPDASPD